MDMTWRERIAAAKRRGRFTSAEKTLAASWCTCAVGEQHATHPSVVVYSLADPTDLVWRIGGPVSDEWLLAWGSDFASAVFDDHFSLAEQLLDQIEDRVLQLKRDR